MVAWLPRLVARAPATIHTKLLAAFLSIVVLLIILGAVGLESLNGASRRADELLKLQRHIAVYRQLHHDTTAQLYSVASALLVPEERALETAMRQLNQFGYDVDRLRVAASENVELLDRVQADYERFLKVVTQVVELIRAGRVAEGRELQLAEASPLAERMERLMNELVNKAEAEMVDSIEASHKAYRISRWTVIGFAVGSIGLALILGYAISWSLIGPVKTIDARLQRIASGDFSGAVEVANRDELGTLAAKLNHMNDELRRLYQQLETANRHKSEFLANMSHELRTPLNAIIGFTRIVMRRSQEQLDPKQYENLEKILASGQHLLAVINAILDLAKVEAGRVEVNPDDIPLAPVLEQCMRTVEPLVKPEAVTLVRDFDSALPQMYVDEQKLRQIVINLLSNAAKFTARGNIRLQAHAANGSVAITVADTGIGIPPDKLELVFEEFKQLDASSTRVHPGTGLGLTIARRLARLMGGDIRAESVLGTGSAFTLTLPTHYAPLEA